MKFASLRAARVLICILLSVLIALTVSAAPAASEHKARVRQFVAAFNARDVDAMLALAHADIEWLSIEGTRISTETQGHDALRANMQKYFASCPSCRSRLTQLRSSAQRVSAVEVASWTSNTGAQNQRSLSVYEFEQGLIRRVYYFPAEP